MTEQIRLLCETEKQEILRAVVITRNVVLAAKALGVGRTTIYAKIRRYGLKLTINQILGELKRQQVFPESGRTL